MKKLTAVIFDEKSSDNIKYNLINFNAIKIPAKKVPIYHRSALKTIIGKAKLIKNTNKTITAEIHPYIKYKKIMANASFGFTGDILISHTDGMKYLVDEFEITGVIFQEKK